MVDVYIRWCVPRPKKGDEWVPFIANFFFPGMGNFMAMCDNQETDKTPIVLNSIISFIQVGVFVTCLTLSILPGPKHIWAALLILLIEDYLWIQFHAVCILVKHRHYDKKNKQLLNVPEDQ